MVHSSGAAGTGTQGRHKPVMVAEVVAAMKVRHDGSYIDGTVGEGGHALAIVGAAEPAPRLLGVDLDREALAIARRRLDERGARYTLVEGSFADLQRVAMESGVAAADGVLLDLGVSSLQLESAERGFSFMRVGPLDMRFSQSQRATAHRLVNNTTERDLADVIRRLGEEPGARRLARAIVAARPIGSTVELAAVIGRALGRSGKRGIHPATRTFQALRMEVNRELENIGAGLEQAVALLRSRGRLAVVSYHSLEDRLVKGFMRRESSDCICPPGSPLCVCGHRASIKLVTRRIVRPSEAEIRANPRSRSARLRIAERL